MFPFGDGENASDIPPGLPWRIRPSEHAPFCAMFVSQDDLETDADLNLWATNVHALTHPGRGFLMDSAIIVIDLNRVVRVNRPHSHKTTQLTHHLGNSQ